VRVGQTAGKLGINCDPSAYQLDVVGAGRFSGPLIASNFPSTSDARLKKDVQDADPGECLRLAKAVKPRTYKRIDMNDAPRLGYIAQDWQREFSSEHYRCIMGESQDEEGPLLAIDYSRVVVLVHGALLSVMAQLDAALARIAVLESRL